MRQLKHGDKIRFIVETKHFAKGFETKVDDCTQVISLYDVRGFRSATGLKMICGCGALFQYEHGKHWEFVD